MQEIALLIRSIEGEKQLLFIAFRALHVEGFNINDRIGQLFTAHVRIKAKIRALVCKQGKSHFQHEYWDYQRETLETHRKNYDQSEREFVHCVADIKKAIHLGQYSQGRVYQELSDEEWKCARKTDLGTRYQKLVDCLRHIYYLTRIIGVCEL